VNHLGHAERLANRYRVMRHGESKANASGIIVGRIETDRGGDYGLSELGRRQAAAAARACGLPADTVICSSDFSRARQTAEIVRAQLGAPPVVAAPALRERCFGDLEGSATGNYARVWAADEARAGDAGGGEPGTGGGEPGTGGGEPGTGGGEPGTGGGGEPVPDDGVEPAAAVLDRATALVAELERRYGGRDILLVSHGDTLQILQAGFLRMDPAAHRRLPPLAVAEIRALRLGDRAGGNAAGPPNLGCSPNLGAHQGKASRSWTDMAAALAAAGVTRSRSGRGRCR
jgi:probable phosphoglycerate mutase